MKTSKISVVIPAYNEERYLADCLESLKIQDFKGRFEIIVVDNGSTDKTSQIAKYFGVKVIFTPRSNPACARQDGFKVAKGEIIATLDADNQAEPGWLSTISEEFAKDPKLVSIFGFIKPLEGKILDRILLFLANFASIPHFYVFGKPILIGTNQAIRREVFEKIGGFELLRLPRLHCDIFDQPDLMRNLRNSGKIKFVPKMLIGYSMRRFHEMGYFSMFWSGFLAWFDLVFLKKFQFKFPTVRNVEKRSNLIFDQLGFLLFILMGIVLAVLISPLLFPALFFVHFLIFSNPKIFLKRLVVTGVIFLIGFLPLGSYFLANSSFAKDSIPIKKLRAKVATLDIDEKIKNMTDFELLKFVNSEKIKVLLEKQGVLDFRIGE
ncbi:hypothetical protein A2Z23_00090 [Candidatus Curtissbacteria bacterium RBG_16_39_7]|uniref:Glycosyltransferase 2-like domain-containing protein n=1 Tax=Candidatus Curtissbacteria bacterium RBG_16_39_7 TaxID=1797707 RepID=A0A1F5G1D9_9BACT|nr:MAG: hypothetical protein A2Z23_00090 [Candidatus Curtissbacteria bacterium RBG_16_39_7]